MNVHRLCGLLAILCALLGYGAGYGWVPWLYGYGYSMETLSRLMWYGFFSSMLFCGFGHVIGRKSRKDPWAGWRDVQSPIPPYETASTNPMFSGAPGIYDPPVDPR